MFGDADLDSPPVYLESTIGNRDIKNIYQNEF